MKLRNAVTLLLTGLQIFAKAPPKDASVLQVKESQSRLERDIQEVKELVAGMAARKVGLHGSWPRVSLAGP